MSISQRIAANTLFQIFGKIATGLSTLAITILLTRYLGPLGFGEYTIVFSYIFSFLIIADFGINSIVVREFSKDVKKVKKDFISVLSLRLFLSVLIVSFSILILPLFPYSPVVKRSIIFATILIFGHSLGSSCNIVFQTYLKYKFQFIASLVSSIVQVVFVAVSVFAKLNFLGVVIAVLLGSLTLPIISFIFARRFFSVKEKAIRVAYWRKIMKLTIPVGIGLFLNTLLTKEDITIMIPWLAGMEAVGFYSIGNKIFENILAFPNFFMNAAFPLYVRNWEKSHKELAGTIQLSLDSLLLLGFPLILGAVILAPQIIYIIGGGEFMPGMSSFRVLMMSSLVFFISPIFRWLIIVLNEQRWLPLIYGIALAVDFLLNLVFIPLYGIVGAALVTGISETIVLVLSFYLVYKHLRFIPRFETVLKGAVAALLMSITMYPLRDSYILLPMAAGFFSYLGVLYIFGVFKQRGFKNLFPVSKGIKALFF